MRQPRISMSNCGDSTVQFRFSSILFLVLSLLIAAGNYDVHGQIVIDTNTIIDENNSFPNSRLVLINGASPPTVVDIVEGGEVGTADDEEPEPGASSAKGSSVLNIVGGRIGRIDLLETSSLTMSAGLARARGVGVAAIKAFDNSLVHVSGGRVWGGDHALIAHHNSRIDVSDGMIFSAAEAIVLNDSSILNVSGGTISSDLNDASVITRGFSRLDVSGGRMSSGIFAYDASRVNVTGGTHFVLSASNASVIEVHGENLMLNDGRLTGVLHDGSAINATAEMIGSGQILLVPEPSTIGIFFSGLAAMAIFGPRRKLF